MLPASSSGAGFYELNVFHLEAGETPPAALQPQAQYTYHCTESLDQVALDVHQNLCVPHQVHTWALWLSPLPLSDDEASDDANGNEDNAPDLATAPSAPMAMEAAVADEAAITSTGETAVPDSRTGDAAPGPVVPAHPDQALFDLALTRIQLPFLHQRKFEEMLAHALAQATEVHTSAGLSEEEALAAARSAAWTFPSRYGPT